MKIISLSDFFNFRLQEFDLFEKLYQILVSCEFSENKLQFYDIISGVIAIFN